MLFQMEVILKDILLMELNISHYQYIKKSFSYFLSNKLKTIYEEEKPDIVHVRSRMPAWINYFAFKKLARTF